MYGQEEIEAGKRHGLIGMVKTHPASVRGILLLFSDRENLLLLTLDGHIGCTTNRPSLFALREII